MRRSGNEQKNGRAGSSADADDLCSHPHPCGVEKGAGGDENRTGRMDDQKQKDKEKDEESWQQEMLDSVNAARKKAGVAPLELDKKVGKAAQLRANECKQSYDHTRPNGKNPRQRWMMQASATPGGEKISTKNRRPYSPPCSPGWSQRVTRRIS